MSTLEIFFEGGQALKRPLISFLKTAVPESQGRIRIRLGKNKDETVRDFLRTLREEPKANAALLVDSDAPDDGRLFESLKQTSTWRENRPRRVSEERVHWMVQIMESWFLADQQALKSYYVRNYRPKALQAWRNVEQVSKSDVLKFLKRASNGGYDKPAHAPKILTVLDPERVRKRAPNCDRLLKFIAGHISDRVPYG